MSERPVTAALLIIGSEILSGRTRDANLPYLARTLNTVGVRLREVRVVPDVEAEIIDAVNALRQRYDYLFTTGGIGPTHDDITAECVARALGRRLIQNPEARQRLERHYTRTGLELTEARLRMANTPEAATLIDNPVSSAPGFQVGNVFVLAGVPRIMQAMLDGIKDRLQGGRPVLSRSLLCNLGEGTLAAGLGEIQRRHPEVEIGSYPRFGSGSYRVTLVLRHTDEDRLEQVLDEVSTLIRGLGGDPRAREDDDPDEDEA
ncbi:MAG: competence/damage-inducible protein A [Candidatus Competibacterales bacterium]|nr:competence/damage-inducible protein A [Candidatus Competibacterales bacterium]